MQDSCMMDFEFVDGYLERIDLPLIPSNDPDSLLLLQTNHVRHVPFENLDIIAGKGPLSLNIDDLWDKIVRRHRGGICYEQNILFANVLERLGFSVRRMAGHHPLSGTNEFDHMFLLVDFPKRNETWISDVGFGNNIFAPVKFELGRWQSDLRDMLRLDTLGYDVYDLVRRDSFGEEEVMYEFNMRDHRDEDYQPRCDYFSTSPDSFFNQGPIVSIDAIGGRMTLTENNLHFWVDGEERTLEIRDEEHRAKILAEEFGIVL